MSVSHSIDVLLDVKYNRQEISKLIQRGQRIGFIYYDHIWGERYSDSPTLDVEGAVKKIFRKTKESEDRPNVYIKYEDTYFFMWVDNNSGQLGLFIGSFGYPWRKEFWNGGGEEVYVDFARYIRLIFQLCEAFTIVKLETFTNE